MLNWLEKHTKDGKVVHFHEYPFYELLGYDSDSNLSDLRRRIRINDKFMRSNRNLAPDAAFNVWHRNIALETVYCFNECANTLRNLTKGTK